jgi:hypothetical protein
MQVRFDVMDAMEQSIALSNPLFQPANRSLAESGPYSR